MNKKIMSSDVLREQLRRIPFHSIALLLPSGKVVAINNPELTMFTETGRTLLVAQGERIIYIDVATVEALETTASNDINPA